MEFNLRGVWPTRRGFGTPPRRRVTVLGTGPAVFFIPRKKGKEMSERPSGDNSVSPEARARLQSIVDRIERLEQEKKNLANDIKDFYHEAKSAGFDVKALRQLIRKRARDAAEVEAEETMIDVYRHALGM